MTTTSQFINNHYNVSSQGQFTIQRKIFSDIYPCFPEVLTFKVYIYLCKAVDWRIKKVTTAKSVIKKDLHLKDKQLNAALTWLENNYFIRRTNKNNHQMFQAQVLTVPDYDQINNVFVSCEEISTNTLNLKRRNQGYIMVPTDAVTNEMLENKSSSKRIWTKNRLATILMLYANCWLEYFGGVNPDVIKVDKNGKNLEINPSFYYSLKASRKESIKTIESLIRMQLFKVVPVYFENAIYVGDQAMKPMTKKYDLLFVLRPYHLALKKLWAPEMDDKRGFMIK